MNLLLHVCFLSLKMQLSQCKWHRNIFGCSELYFTKFSPFFFCLFLFALTKEGEEEGTYRSINQFHYLAWPDHGVPEYPYTLLAFVKRIRQMTPPKPEKGNIIVHCRLVITTFIVRCRLVITIHVLFIAA